jgi:hypothetical protein
MWQRGKIIELLGDRFRCSGNSLEFLSGSSLSSTNEEAERYFLGLDKSGTPYFVLHKSTEITQFPKEYELLRTIGKSLNSLEIGAAVHALAIAQWHDAHRRCAKCGAKTRSTMGGAIKQIEFFSVARKFGLQSVSQHLLDLLNRESPLKALFCAKYLRNAAEPLKICAISDPSRGLSRPL